MHSREYLEKDLEITKEIAQELGFLGYSPEGIEVFRTKYMEAAEYWDKAMEPLFEKIREAERITAKDLSVMVF